ncbi:MAG TPA: hypothetical protein VK687_09360, partial [Bryobacteraceae bacterium]|nr:hypothetical protein [Bryobacteraceae bacterium]
LLRGPFKRYPLLLLYCVFQISAVILSGWAFFFAGAGSALYRNLYWTADVLVDLLLFLMVMTMTREVMKENPLWRVVGRMLLIIVVAAVVLPFVLFHPFFTQAWYRHTSQLLSFAGALMNLFLWTGIIGKRDRDPQLLPVCAGLGVAVTGVAITYGLLQFTSANLRWLPDLFKSLTQVGSMVIWCWAFWPSTRESSSPIEAVADPS